MRRFSISLTLGVLALMLMALPASAGRSWCARDPIVSLDGTPVQVWVAIPDEFVPYANGPIEVKFKAPKSIKERKVLYTDSGFNGHGEKVSWSDLKGASTINGLIPLEIEVRVHMDQKKVDNAFGKDTPVPVQVTVNQGETTESWIEYGTSRNTKFSVVVMAVEDTTP
jgi:hypothetical protein